MPPKREAAATPTLPAAKMIKIGTDAQEFGCDPMDDKSRLAEDANYSPFPNNEEAIDFDEENIASPGIRTDTISLLMKIEQLQAQLKYERRCRILAERELRELKEMNTLMMQMRHTAHELRVTLDHVLQGGDAAAPQNSQDEAVSFLSEPEAEMRQVHNFPEDDHTFLYLSENLRVPKNLYERIAEIADYKKYTSALLMIIFDRQTLATHSLQGRRSTFTGEECHKPQLPPDILRSIIDHVAAKFGIDNSQIKTAIRTKLNNEDKLLKKRLGLSKAESKALIEQSFCQDASLLPENGAMGNDTQL
ncbi:uncharacterized protein LOC125893757 isoform X2 [Epinephelus fuscoguttatus]|uniref:uncharacterized protein LOC125893757 isoform X2 n=1 Tax=Epinephelus fuscoguttatus TaxID=293821 RepID=UPI0020D00C89|nr:uncharacterized protein LOC125893757 isoform X2 [Epinephelus fuscoguttatus]